MPLNPNIALQTRNPQIQSPMDSYARAMQMKGMGQQNEMNELELGRMKREDKYEQSPGYQQQLQDEQEKATNDARKARAEMTLKEQEVSDKEADVFARAVHPILHMDLSKRQAELRPTLDRLLKGGSITQEQHDHFAGMKYPELESHILSIYKGSKLHLKIGAEMREAKRKKEAAEFIGTAKVDAAALIAKAKLKAGEGETTEKDPTGDFERHYLPGWLQREGIQEPTGADTQQAFLDFKKDTRAPGAGETPEDKEQRLSASEYKYHQRVAKHQEDQTKEIEAMQMEVENSTDLPNYRDKRKGQAIANKYAGLLKSAWREYQAEIGGDVNAPTPQEGGVTWWNEALGDFE